MGVLVWVWPTVIIRALAVAVVVLIGAVMAIATARLGLYERAYGATVLRLYSTWFAWWLGALFVPVGAAWVGLFPSKRWLGKAGVVLALTWLVAVNVINPEAMVARRNVAHAERTGTFDGAYLASLGPDATPTLLARLQRLERLEESARLEELERLDRAQRQELQDRWEQLDPATGELRAELCRRESPDQRIWGLGWSWSRFRAERARQEHC